MEAEDDMIVLVVVDEEENSKYSLPEVKKEIESGLENSLKVEDIMETAEKHGEYIAVKIEPDNYDCDYPEDDMLQQVLKSETNDNPYQEMNNIQEDEEYLPDNVECYEEEKYGPEEDYEKHRFVMLKPWQQKSFVGELRKQFTDLRENEELLINTLEQIMRSVKPPPPPRDYYIMNGIMLECVYCRTISETIPAASRHFQEKHGVRYLVCYACGVDFRSTTNLYKHEKRCVAPDALLVLKARAACLGSKGRGRPYIKLKSLAPKRDRVKFPCQLCSAVFMTRSNLQAHSNLHRGERPFRCHACPAAYISHSALSRHTKKHTDEQYICDHCNRSFKMKASLVSHLDTHKPLRKHGCTECSRRFAQKSALTLHINKVHRNLPPPCACQICPKRYRRMSLLKAHMKRAHGMSIITRKMFFKSLPTMTELEVRQSKVILKSIDDVIKYEPPQKKEDKIQRSVEEHIETKDHNIEYGDHNIKYKKLIIEDEDQNVDHNPNPDCIQIENPRFDSKDIGSNVIYIKNGEIIQGTICGETQDNFILEVEAMVDESEEVLQNLNVADSIKTFSAVVKSDDIDL